MCRLFGFRSVLNSRVHASLVSAENALMGQSKRHPDGWGIAYYVHHTPHLIKSTATAETDELFKSISGVVTSQTVIAHIRKATHGKLSIINTHPFQFGKWTFAHNGNIRDFKNLKTQMEKLSNHELGKFCLGETDSEKFFFYLLSYIEKRVDLSSKNLDIRIIAEQIKLALTDLTAHTGALTVSDKGKVSENYLTFLISNGPMLIAFHGGMPLYFSTHKKNCPERDTCKSFNESCENKLDAKAPVNHLLVSSEPLQGENVWKQLQPGELIGVDDKMFVHQDIFQLPFVFPNE